MFQALGSIAGAYGGRKKFHGWRLMAIYVAVVAIFLARCLGESGAWTADFMGGMLVCAAIFMLGGVAVLIIDLFAVRRERRAIAEGGRLARRLQRGEETDGRRKERACALGGVLLVPTLCFALTPKFMHEWANSRWPSAVAVVTDTDIRETFGWWHVGVSIRYEADGRAHYRRLRASGHEGLRSEAAAKALAGTYYQGRSFTVFHDPIRPSKVVWERATRFGAVIRCLGMYLVGGVIFGVSCHILLFSQAHSRRALALDDPETRAKSTWERRYGMGQGPGGR